MLEPGDLGLAAVSETSPDLGDRPEEVMNIPGIFPRKRGEDKGEGWGCM